MVYFRLRDAIYQPNRINSVTSSYNLNVLRKNLMENDHALYDFNTVMGKF